MSQQWTKPVKKMVGMKNKGQGQLDGGHYSGDYENGCSNKDN